MLEGTPKTTLDKYIRGYEKLHAILFGPTINNQAFSDNPIRAFLKSLSLTAVSFYLTVKFWQFQDDFLTLAKSQQIDQERAYELSLFSEPKTNLVVSQGAAILYFVWGSNILKLGVNLVQNFLYLGGAYFFRGLVNSSNKRLQSAGPVKHIFDAYLSLRQLFQSICWLVIAGTVVWKGQSFFNNLLQWDQTIQSIPALNVTNNHFNIGGNCELENINLVRQICNILSNKLNNKVDFKKLITFVHDRPGHDYRYAIDNSLIKETLNWKPETEFRRGISDTIDFYLKKFQAEFVKDSSNNYLKDII